VVGEVVNAGLDPLAAEKLPQPTPPPVQYPYRLDMINDLLKIGGQQTHPRYLRQQLPVEAGQGHPPGRQLPGKAPQLHLADGRQHIVQVLTIPLVADVELPSPLFRITLLGVLFHTQQPGVTNPLGNLRVAGDHRSSLAAGDILDAVKTETGDIPPGADFSPLKETSKGKGRVLDDPQAMSMGKLIHRIQVSRLTAVMHRHNGPGASGLTRFCISQVQRDGLRIHFTATGTHPAAAIAWKDARKLRD
jgi:hypothetical protein